MLGVESRLAAVEYFVTPNAGRIRPKKSAFRSMSRRVFTDASHVLIGRCA